MTTLLLPSNTELRHRIEIKRSEFITVIRRIETQEAARDFINQVRDEFPDARHHCSAYVISVPGAQPLMHSSDDGEPSGTAGRPMLDVLTGFNLCNIVAVVVRYFGGTLLGTGGLVRAYSNSVRECLLGEPILTPHSLTHCTITARHDIAGKLEADLRGRGYDLLNVHYHATTVTLELAIEDAQSFAAELAELTSGQCSPKNLGAIIREVPAGKLS